MRRQASLDAALAQAPIVGAMERAQGVSDDVAPLLEPIRRRAWLAHRDPHQVAEQDRCASLVLRELNAVPRTVVQEIALCGVDFLRSEMHLRVLRSALWKCRARRAPTQRAQPC